MYAIVVYKTESGNVPLMEYYKELAKKHKDSKIAAVKATVDLLALYGFDINRVRKNNTLKKLAGYDNLWELRVSDDRVLLLYFDSNGNSKFVLLHAFEKNSQKTPLNELQRAVREAKDYIRRFGS